jgi:hypothetical protein
VRLAGILQVLASGDHDGLDGRVRAADVGVHAGMVAQRGRVETVRSGWQVSAALHAVLRVSPSAARLATSSW